MKLKHLKLNFFKNHIKFEVDTTADVIGIHGLNGKGKTNILDAIHMLCIGKSYFSATDIQCINNNHDGASIIGQFDIPEKTEVKIRLEKGKRKYIEKNGKKISKVLDYVGQFFAVVIAPSDISLIYGGNAERRRFIDQIICQLSNEYLLNLVAYNKLIEQRNSHLKSPKIDVLLIESLDAQISPLCNAIHKERKQFVIEFIPFITKYYLKLSGKNETIDVIYKSQLDLADYNELVEQNKNKDRILKRSTVGIHKDEIEIILDTYSLKKYGSQGQIKSCLIALKLAEYNYFRIKKDSLPLLLLDDIFEKIDDERAKALTEIIKSGTFGQLYVSDTQAERLFAFCNSINSNHQLIKL